MKLFLLRHGKTEPNSITGKDFDRKLMEKGIQQAKEIGKYLKRNNINPPVILCSSSVRTKETIRNIQKETVFTSKIDYLNDLYLCNKKELLSILFSQNHSKDIFILGHNNGLSDFASYLIEDFVDLKTCDFIEIELNIESWNEASKGLGKAISRFYPALSH
jgi:phosphohistidine phosphatase